MAAEATPNILGQRYRLLNLLGEGGMGHVYRAVDRLTGQVLALKRVLIPTEQLIFTTRVDSNIDMEFALAQEFQLLATLRHPSIISVLDYGFDNQRHPFLAMDLIENAQDIHSAADNQPLTIQVELFIQLLQALAYLHRRDVVHRDLKPTNVLVKAGQVKVLDFGISLMRGQMSNIAGTLLYMAPEILKGDPVSVAADLYAVGVMMYELLLGKAIFKGVTPNSLVEEILNTPMDLLLAGVPNTMVGLLSKLLAKNPNERYANAEDVIKDLSVLVHQPVIIEKGTDRESFLQTTKLVGREAELQLLSNSLIMTVDGLGGSWLVGGESGIGKSRLLDELRIFGLVNGVLVMRGHAISGGSKPYEMWREPLRRLILASDIDDTEASILKTIVPDIATLLERKVEDAPEFDSEATQGRLLSTVANIIKRHDQAMLILLENLHWTDDESLILLAWLIQMAAWLPLMIVGSYRNDEQPTLPARLREMQVITLKRLSPEAIVQLSGYMLGTAGKDPSIIALLQRETEGNPFFLVEVVRALAEEAGQIDKIGEMPLPEQIFTGGVRRIIERRLSRVPMSARTVLQIAAVGGNQLDLDILCAIDPSLNVERWLRDCLNAVVLELQDGNWHFAHDKLRAGLLDGLNPKELSELHRRFAVAIETVYPDANGHAAALAYHWSQAQDSVKEAKYAALAGERALRSGAYQTAVPYLVRALSLASGTKNGNSDAQVRQAYLGRQLAEAFYGTGDLPKSREYQEQALALLDVPAPTSKVQLYTSIAQNALIERIHEILPPRMPETSPKKAAIMEAAAGYQQLVQIYYSSGEVLPLINANLRALNLSITAGVSSPAVLAQSYANMAVSSGFLSLHNVAEQRQSKAREIIQSVSDSATAAWILQLMGTYDVGVGQWGRAEKELAQAVEMADRIGHKRRWQECSTMVTTSLVYQGQIARAAQKQSDIASATRREGTPATHARVLLAQVESALMLGQLNDAVIFINEAASVTSQNMGPLVKLRIYAFSALASLYRDDLEPAQQAADHTMEDVKQPIPIIYLLPSYVALNEVYLSLWEKKPTEKITPRAQQAYDILNKISRMFPIAEPSALRMKGRIDWLSGQQEHAQQAWQKSITLAETLAMPYEQALAHYEIGRHLGATNPNGQQHLTKATELFTKVGATYQLSQLQRA